MQCGEEKTQGLCRIAQARHPISFTICWMLLEVLVIMKGVWGSPFAIHGIAAPIQSL